MVRWGLAAAAADVDLDGYDALDNTRAAVLSSDDEEERDERPSHR